MNKLLLFFFLIPLFFAKSYGQTVNTGPKQIIVKITKEKNPKKIYAKVENMSAFHGTDSSWAQWVEKNINQTIELDKRAKKGKYIVTVKFIVAKDGSISDIQCETDPGFGTCTEVLRVIKKSKNWTPAQQSGRKVREYRRG